MADRDERTTTRTTTGAHTADRKSAGSGKIWPWLLGLLLLLLLAVILFFVLGGDADIDAEGGDIDVPAVDADVEAPDVDADIDVEEGGDAEAEVEGEPTEGG